jgi:hypothetical protein
MALATVESCEETDAEPAAPGICAYAGTTNAAASRQQTVRNVAGRGFTTADSRQYFLS